MPSSPVTKVVEHLRKTVLRQGEDSLSDGKLLDRFLDKRDEVAFAALVRRHGPMVWGVCRRIVGQAADAEDAFQAAFLILVRKAAAVKPREAVGNWLYGVACHTALKARTACTRVRAKEKQVNSMPEPAREPRDDREELQRLLDQELSALPDKYRLPVVLCDLEGRTRKEVAVQLKIPQGTLSSRLATAHQMLAKRLARHGLAVSGGSLAALFAQNAASACVPASVVSSTIKTAALVAASNGAVAGIVSTKVAALTEGVMKAMLLTKLNSATLVFLVLALFGSGIGMLALPAVAVQEGAKNGAAEPPVQEKKTPQTDLQRLHGTWTLVEAHKHGKKVAATDMTVWPIQPHKLAIDGEKSPKHLRTPRSLEPNVRVGGVVLLSAFINDGKSADGDFQLNATKSPKEITMTWFLLQWVCIYKVEGDTLTICFNPKNYILPDEFRTMADSERVLFVYHRAKPDPEPKKAKNAPKPLEAGKDSVFGRMYLRILEDDPRKVEDLKAIDEPSGRNVLAYALTKGYKRIAAHIVESGNAELGHADKSRDTPLHELVKTTDVALVKRIFEKYPQHARKGMLAHNRSGWAPLDLLHYHHKPGSEMEKAVEAALDSPLNADRKAKIVRFRRLLDAISESDLNLLVKAIKEDKSLVNFVNPEGYPPLTSAGAGNNLAAVHVLLAYGADPLGNAQTTFSPVEWALANKKPDVLRALKSAGVSLQDRVRAFALPGEVGAMKSVAELIEEYDADKEFRNIFKE